MSPVTIEATVEAPSVLAAPLLSSSSLRRVVVTVVPLPVALVGVTAVVDSVVVATGGIGSLGGVGTVAIDAWYVKLKG